MASDLMTKKISFEYKGGEYIQKLSIRGENLPWRYECNEDWITITTGPTSLTISVAPTYDFRKREGNINIYDKFNNKLTLNVVQTGYMDLRIECPSSIVLYHTYYDLNDLFSVYLTIYGGERQEPSCNQLKPYISKVWDNSALYNDFVIRVPKTLEGTFTIEHMEARQFRKYCKENHIEYDNSLLKKTITITQLTAEDIVGEMVINIDGVNYKSGQECIVYINEKEAKTIDIVSTKFIKLKSNTEYDIIDNKNVELTKMARWVDVTNKPGSILIKANDANMLTERQCLGRIVNTDNPHQYIDILIRQGTSF